MINDEDLWKAAIGYIKRGSSAPRIEVELPLMTVGALLLVAFELRRIANKADRLIELADAEL